MYRLAPQPRNHQLKWYSASDVWMSVNEATLHRYPPPSAGDANAHHSGTPEKGLSILKTYVIQKKPCLDFLPQTVFSM